MSAFVAAIAVAHIVAVASTAFVVDAVVVANNSTAAVYFDGTTAVTSLIAHRDLCSNDCRHRQQDYSSLM